MGKKRKFLFLDLLGIFFLGLGITAIANSIHNGHPTQILYLCYFGLLFIGIGILTKRSYLILSQVYILAIPLIIWNVDFFYQLISGHPLWGLTNYFFVDSKLTIGKFVSLQHIYTIPVSLYAALLIGIRKSDFKARIWSLVQVTLSFFLVLFFSNPDLNVNCVINPCMDIYSPLPYKITWIIMAYGMIFLSSYLVNTLITKKLLKK